MMERARRAPAGRRFSIALLLFLFGASLVVPALAFTAVGRKVLGRPPPVRPKARRRSSIGATGSPGRSSRRGIASWRQRAWRLQCRGG